MSRLLWHSAAPWCATGYGQQTALAVRRLAAAGHEVGLSCYHGLQGAVREWEGLTCFPGRDDWGDRMLSRYAEAFGPDLIVTLLDVWALRRGESLRGLPVACWTPVDHEPLGLPLLRFFEASGARPIAMSRHGEGRLMDAGLRPIRVPHAIDTSVHSPRDRGAARDEFGLPREAFVVGMVATNADDMPSRKAWPEAIEGFARLRADHDDAILYMHTDLNGQGGINIPWLCDRLGLPPEALRGTPALAYDLGLPAEATARLYSAFDVLLSPSYGEGFGLAPLEAQACGTPVIVSDFSAQPELLGAGWKVGGERWWVNMYRAFWQRPSVDSIHEALLSAYDARGDLSLREGARRFALDFDADKVFETHWLPALDELLSRPNRAARRATARMER